MKINWKDKNFIEHIINESYCKRDVLKKLKLCTTGSNTVTLNKWIKKHDIDISHFNPYRYSMAALRNKNTIPLNEILEGKHPQFNRGHLKRKLLNSGIKTNKCEKCGQDEMWNKIHLTMQLDHINGINDDNRLENLRMICPNCHSQTPTYAGKNSKTIKTLDF